MVSVKIGLIADVQYCDCDDGYNFNKSKKRFYRNSLCHLDNAIHHFSSNGCDKILQLGDLIDGKCHTFEITEKVMRLMAKRFDTCDFETFHVIGNHELYNFSREKFCHSFLGDSLKRYQTKVIDLNYYKVDLSEDVCLIVLDCYDISVLSKREKVDNDHDYLAGVKILTAKNYNENWNDASGDMERKYVAYNGAIGPSQLKWFEEQLAQATADNKIVILAGHIPIMSRSSNYECLLWNNEMVVDLINQFPCVKAYFCGHAHEGKVLKTDKLIHITMPGVIESLDDQCAYSIVEITKEKLHISAAQGYWDDIEFVF